MKEFPRVNDVVITPNGKGVVQGKMYESGRPLLIVRHVIEEMTAITLNNCLTQKAAAKDPRYPTGLWVYDLTEVSYA